MIETLGELMPAKAKTKYRPRNETEAARTCYDHMAGQLGTALADVMLARHHIRPQGTDFVLAKSGRAFLAGLGVDVDGAKAQRRMFARRCLDWTERRYQLGGALGAAQAHHCFHAGWLRRPDDDRVIVATSKGARAFADHFGVEAAR